MSRSHARRDASARMGPAVEDGAAGSPGRGHPAEPARAAARWVSRSLTAGPWLAVALVAAGWVTYPGGTWWDRSARGPSLVDTFLCDLLGPTAIDGHPNGPAATLTAVGLGSFAALLTVAWWRAAPKLAGANRPALRTARLLGVAGVAPLVAALASAGSPSHPLAIALAAAAELGALASFAAAVPPHTALRRASLALFALGAAGVAMYGPTIADSTALPLRGTPLVQRLGLLALAVWLTLIGRAVDRPAEAASSDASE